MLTGKKQEEAGKQRRKYTKEEIFAAARVHECHTLCLISRGHMLDVAASDPLVQVLGRSASSSRPASDKLLCSLALALVSSLPNVGIASSGIIPQVIFTLYGQKGKQKLTKLRGERSAGCQLFSCSRVRPEELSH